MIQYLLTENRRTFIFIYDLFQLCIYLCLSTAKNGSGATETKQWQDMIAKPRQSVVVWHRLKPAH